jgi:DNA-binding MarR family transcriptional regulator
MRRRTVEGDAVTELVLEIFRSNGRLLAAGDALTRPFGQSAARWQVLGAIRPGPQTVAGVARIMGLARQSVQRTTDLLAAQGLVEYIANPAHRRAKLAQLSEQGQEFLTDLAPLQADWANGLARAIGFNEGEIRRALEVVRAIRLRLEEGKQAGANFEMTPRRTRRGGDGVTRNGRRGRGSP